MNDIITGKFPSATAAIFISWQFTCFLFYTRVKRSTERVKRRAQEHHTMTTARSEHKPLDPKLSAPTISHCTSTKQRKFELRERTIIKKVWDKKVTYPSLINPE